jgi:hypothetical protein
MHEDLREKAKERVRAKSDFVTTAITFLGISVVLGLLSFYLPPIAFWLLLPLPIFAMILGIMYVKIYGYNLFGTPSLDWEEREIEKEMYRLAQEKGHFEESPPSDDLSEEDHLELRELDRLQRKWGTRDEDFV